MFNQNIKSPVNISVSKIHPFEGNPYKVLDNEEKNFLIESIQQQGIISPVVVRPLENTKDEYEVISGHRRMRASQKAGLETVPAFIYAVTRDEASIMLVDSNLHREHILPSEKAFAYKLKLEAIKRQSERTDLTSRQVVGKLESAELVSDTESGRQVQRYIRLTYLIPELLELVDEEKIALTPAVELSYLNEVEQADLVEEISVCDATPNLSQAQRLRAISREEGLTPEHIGEILAEEKANQRPTIKFSVNRKKKPDGTIYKDHFYYACKHRMKVDGHKCDYHRQWNQTVVNSAVEEVIEKLVSNPEFEKALCEKINTRVSTEGLEEELAVFKKQLNQLVMSKRKLASQMDTLDVTDRHYDKKYQDMQNRLYDFYDEIEVAEEQITELQSRIANIKEEKISGENVYLFLHYYGTMYKEFTDAEKKRFLNTFIESIEIFKEEQPNGRLLKCINFKFPVFYDGDENVTHICWDSETTVEVVCSLSKK